MAIGYSFAKKLSFAWKSVMYVQDGEQKQQEGKKKWFDINRVDGDDDDDDDDERVNDGMNRWW